MLGCQCQVSSAPDPLSTGFMALFLWHLRYFIGRLPEIVSGVSQFTLLSLPLETVSEAISKVLLLCCTLMPPSSHGPRRRWWFLPAPRRTSITKGGGRPPEARLPSPCLVESLIKKACISPPFLLPLPPSFSFFLLSFSHPSSPLLPPPTNPMSSLPTTTAIYPSSFATSPTSFLSSSHFPLTLSSSSLMPSSSFMIPIIISSCPPLPVPCNLEPDIEKWCSSWHFFHRGLTLPPAGWHHSFSLAAYSSFF